MDSLKGPFTYEALPPKDIKFVPLNQTQEMNGEELMEFYEVWRQSVVVSPNPLADTHVERQTSWPISAHHSRLSGVPRNLRLKPRGLLASSYHQRRPFEDFSQDSQYLHRMHRPRQD